ncbi:MAG TPA: hypothetical protein VFX49_11750 [Chloroflexota bacterium]|nr:hypothetical protein [Chloroflexota bacterium]
MAAFAWLERDATDVPKRNELPDRPLHRIAMQSRCAGNVTLSRRRLCALGVAERDHGHADEQRRARYSAVDQRAD